MSGRKKVCIAVCLLLSAMLGGLAATGILRYGGFLAPEIVLIDLQKMLDAKKSRYAERVKTLRAANDTEALKRTNAEINEYIERLQAELARQGANRIVLVKDAVVAGEVRDITAEVEKSVEGERK